MIIDPMVSQRRSGASGPAAHGIGDENAAAHVTGEQLIRCWCSGPAQSAQGGPARPVTRLEEIATTRTSSVTAAIWCSTASS